MVIVAFMIARLLWGVLFPWQSSATPSRQGKTMRRFDDLIAYRDNL